MMNLNFILISLGMERNIYLLRSSQKLEHVCMIQDLAKDDE